MQFIIYTTDQGQAASAPPTAEQMAALGQLTEESRKSGVLVVTGGAAAHGTRLRLAAGNFTTTDGPFIEAKELTGGFAIIRAQSLEEAVEWAKRFRDIVGDGESEIVQIYGPDDFGPA